MTNDKLRATFDGLPKPAVQIPSSLTTSTTNGLAECVIDSTYEPARPRLSDLTVIGVIIILAFSGGIIAELVLSALAR